MAFFKMDKYLDSPLLVFDLETTGLDVEKNEIIRFYGVLFDPDGSQKTLNLVCKPKGEIDAGATKVHGIVKEDLEQEVSFEKNAPLIVKWLPSEKFNVGGYNVLKFDLPVLDRQLRECGYTNVFQRCHVIDSLDLYRKHFPRTLEMAYLHYTKQKMENAHDACSDTLATCKVLASQIEREQVEITKLASSSPDTRVGFSGHFKKTDKGDIVLAFGKYNGVPLSKVDIGYLQWILKKDFPVAVKDRIRSYLKSLN